MLVVTTGCVLFLLGTACLLRWIPGLADYGYPIVWCGLLMMVDEWNWRRYRLSLWREHPKHFFCLTLPSSALVWVLMEALNLPAPQWRYRGGLPGIWVKTLFGFVAFSTVIPIVMEAVWLVGGGQRIPASIIEWSRRNRLLCFVMAALLAGLPFVNRIFWFNQGIWLIPALVLLPFVRNVETEAAAFGRTLAFGGLLAGFAWELFNYPSRTHWEYLILPDVPHLFYMPLPGYIGFIPFSFSMIVVFEFLQSIRTTAMTALILYALALAGLYSLTVLYLERGIWLGI